MERELATQWQDRPHPFTQARGPVGTCDCGRSHSDELHGEQARELASSHPDAKGLVRETGT